MKEDRLNINWETHRKGIKKKEFIVIFSSFFIMFFGFVCDLLVLKGCNFFVVRDINNVSLVSLQIQATITTLTLTIIALLSGNITDSYMGISISAYFLELRPVILKQSRIIILEFAALALSVVFHIVGFYNSVFSCLIASMFIIIMAIFEIYAVFKGRKNSEDEISLYVNYLIEEKDNYLEIGKNFLYDWKKIVVDQSVEEFDFYLQMFFSLINNIFLNHKKTDEINELAESIALFLLTNESANCKCKGVNFVIKFYENVCIWISCNQEVVKEIEGSISLISLVYKELYSAFMAVGVERLERENFQFDDLAEYVFRVVSWIGYLENKHSFEVTAINYIARFLGRFLKVENKKGNIINSSYWKSIIMDNYDYLVYGIPEESKTFYKDSLVLRDFNIIFGYLFDGQLEYVIDGFFLDGISEIYEIKDESLVFKTMLIHCYMYYLAYRESNECIEKNLQENIKKMITEKSVVESINNFYYCLSKKDTLLDDDFENKIRSTLSSYELSPEHCNSKTSIIDGVIRDYCLYVTILISRCSHDNGLLERLLNVQEYSPLLKNSRLEELKKKFVNLHSMFNKENLSDDEVKKKSEEMICIFTSVMKEKYKKYICDIAENIQKDFSVKNIKEREIKKIEEIIIDKFKSYFDYFSKQCGTLETYEKVCVLSIKEPTDMMVNYDCRGDISNYANAKFIEWIIDTLSSHFGVSIIDRNSKFNSDEDFRNYLQSHNYNILVGSRYPFDIIDYQDYDKHNEFISSRDCLFSVARRKGMALRKNSLFLKLNDVIVEISTPSIEDVRVKRSKESGLYVYTTVDGVKLEFEKEDLQKYIYNEYKVVKVYVNVTIGFSDNVDDAVIITRSSEK